LNPKTLIELYAERPLENVLAVEVFRPKRVVYISPNDFPDDAQATLNEYFAHRGIKVRTQCRRTDVYDSVKTLAELRKLLQKNPDAMIDITGGTDVLLFATGEACVGTETPVITYSRRKNRFYSIQHADFADGVAGDVHFTVEDIFKMAGGSMRRGRVDNAVLGSYMDLYDPFFDLYLQHRTRWDRIATYIQRVSAADEEGFYSLEAEGEYEVKGSNGHRLSAPEEALSGMEKIGMIRNLKIVPNESVRFTFRDDQCRTWLRDVGSVLELYVYKACLDTKIFDDVRSSAVVDWNGTYKDNAVSNELDVMCTRGIHSFFISCKTCMVRTEALNELAILRDRFGGQVARAALVTAEPANAAARNRAAELDIRIIDLADLKSGRIKECIQALAN